MCGINGIVNFKTSPEKELVLTMNKCLAHRGPDNEGLYADNKIVLGHRRLSIIDLSPYANQPLISADGRHVIVYNGELYNYTELKKELNEFEYKTNSDTEVILNAFIKWGVECLHRFNGMFAFAIWDKQTQKLTLARDRMGVKPLYFYNNQQELIFSSEIRAILVTNKITPTLDYYSLIQYLQFQTVYAPNTLLTDIKMLLPGHFIEVTEDAFKIKKYWDLDTPKNRTEKISYPEACKRTAELFQRSVSRRLISDVPFGAFLSGGIDSTAVVAVMSKLSNHPVKTFSIIFNEKDFTEETYSNLVAKKFNTHHHPIKLSVNDFKNLLPDALDAMDHPSGDGPNTFVVSKFTKEAGITMALSGIGGDELFAGYPVFNRLPKMFKYRALSGIPKHLRNILGQSIAKLKPGISTQKLSWLLNSSHWDFNTLYHLNRKVFHENDLSNLLEQEINDLYALNLNTIFNPEKICSSISIAEYKTYLQNVLLRDTDQMSMAHALEVREPFMDYELIEYVLSLPDEFKLNKQPKKLLIDALGDLIPTEVYNRPKMGFTLPWKHWMQNDLKSFCEERLYSLSKRPYFKKEEILQLWQRFLNNDPVITWSRIWPLVVLEHWLSKNKIN